MTFLKFSRDAEHEADFLGLQYMYKGGYDRNAYVTFFERIQADKKRRPGTIPKVFSTHPPTRTWQVNLVSWIIVECSVVFTPGRFPDLRINRGDEREGQTSSDRQ